MLTPFNKKGIFTGKNNNIVIYQLEDGKTKIDVKSDDEKIYVIRENNNVKINLEFKKDQSLTTKYIIKDMNTSVDLKTVTKKLSIQDNRICIEYDLYMNDKFSDNFEFKLEWRNL